jgi:hypothetical protein
MYRKYTSLILSLLGLSSLLMAQPVHRVDTLYSTVPQTHQYLHLRVPLGELYMRSSGECGLSLIQLMAPDSAAHHQIDERIDADGNARLYLALDFPGLTPKGSNLRTDAAQTFRLGSDMTSFDHYGQPGSYRSEFNPDPNLSTDLHLDLGVGASRLDFSGLSLRSVFIRSAFADVMISYHEANQIEMQQMDLHVTKGDIVLKQPELARARLVSIQNDMGDTKIILGDDYLPQSTISVHAGMGNCTLIVDAQHPVKVIVKGGLFSDQQIESGFQTTDNQVYTNQAFATHCQHGGKGCPHATRVICNLDLGSLTLMEKP